MDHTKEQIEKSIKDILPSSDIEFFDSFTETNWKRYFLKNKDSISFLVVVKKSKPRGAL